MPTLILRFPGGRYHATPTGHHVNEGVVEWPPSPWRLLRALLACGFTARGWSAVPDAGRRLVEALANTRPHYRLPRGTLAHSRHYMPLGVLAKGREMTTLVFDTWADVGQGELAVCWPAALAPDEQALFEELAAHLGYLGRSESCVEARGTGGDSLWPHVDAFPHEHGASPGPGWEQVVLPIPEQPPLYAAWRERAVADALAPYPLPEGGKRPPAKLAKLRAAAEAPYPPTLLDCLMTDTAVWKAHRWSQPPGLTRGVFWLRSDALEVGTPAASPRAQPAPVECALLALATPSRTMSALPMRTRVVPQAELLHQALVSHAGGGRAVDCPELTGRDAQGAPLRGHRHAHVVPLDLDGDARLDHVLVFAPGGLGAQAQRALRSVERTFMKGGAGELGVALAGLGALGDLRRLDGQLGRSVEALLGPAGGARRWQSLTPFVFPRFVKKRGANSMEGQVQAELESRGLPPARVGWMEPAPDHFRHAVLARARGGAPPPVLMGHGLVLEFDTPVPGPLCLGYASHFGLGVFAAMDD